MKMDRQYLRVCAVYRCLVRYGASYEWAVEKLAEVKVGPGVCDLWYRTQKFRELGITKR